MKTSSEQKETKGQLKKLSVSEAKQVRGGASSLYYNSLFKATRRTYYSFKWN